MRRSKKGMSEQRTQIAERFVESFAGVPLTAECVFRSPQYLDKGTQKEVCDFILVLRDQAILISMKSQEDPSQRASEKLERWIIKNAKSALAQAKGAMRTISRSDFWCQHSRRGRVEFRPGVLDIRHLIVTTEIFNERVRLPDILDLEVGEIPVSYLGLNDLCNLINELRTFPDLDEYLSARSVLPKSVLRAVGDEKPLFTYYIVNHRSFAGCSGYEDARIVAAAGESEIEIYNYFKPLRNRFAAYIECVSDRLATRLEDYDKNLEPALAKLYDDPQNRANYRLMQDELCDLRFSEREHLGLQLHRLREKVESSGDKESMTYGAVYVDSKPDFVYVLISAKGVERVELIKRASVLLRGAVTHYEKERGMVIADRDGENFEVQLAAGLTRDSISEMLAEMYFSKLKITDIECV